VQYLSILFMLGSFIFYYFDFLGFELSFCTRLVQYMAPVLQRKSQFLMNVCHIFRFFRQSYRFIFSKMTQTGHTGGKSFGNVRKILK